MRVLLNYLPKAIARISLKMKRIRAREIYMGRFKIGYLYEKNKVFYITQAWKT